MELISLLGGLCESIKQLTSANAGEDFVLRLNVAFIAMSEMIVVNNELSAPRGRRFLPPWALLGINRWAIECFWWFQCFYHNKLT